MKKFLFLLLAFPFISHAQVITTVAGTGSAGYTGDGGAATAATFNGTSGLVFDTGGNMFVSDYYNHVVRKITKTGIISTYAGLGFPGYSGNGGPATAATLNGPVNLAIDHSGNLYIAEFHNNVIRKISTSGIISTFAGNGTPVHSGDGGAATAAGLFKPSCVAIDGNDEVYIAECSANRVRKVSLTGIISTYAGTGVSGTGGDGGPATAAQVFQPYSIAFDPFNNMYLAESPYDKIRKIDASGTISTFAGNGVAGYSGDGGAATAAKLDNPAGVASDAAGNIYIADQFNHRVRKVALTGIITTIVGNGTSGYSGDGGPDTAAQISDNNVIAFSKSGKLYLTDNSNNVVRKLDTATIPPSTLSVHVFPNPSGAHMSVALPPPYSDGNVQIIDMAGHVLLDQKIVNGVSTLHMAPLATGMYLMKLECEGQSMVQKVYKN